VSWGEGSHKERFAISETGTGFACGAKLSEVPPPVANAPVVGMTQEARVARFGFEFVSRQPS
jgi:hypothetical protein